jgi:hypothetical protein
MSYPPSAPFPSEVLFPVFEHRGKGTPPDLIYCGDNKGAKKTAAGMIRDVGSNPVDVGLLPTARYMEPFSLVAAQLAYNGSDGRASAYRFERFGKLPRKGPDNAMTALAGWENFYVIVGSYAGALIGLQFVVITLIADTSIATTGDISVRLPSGCR